MKRDARIGMAVVLVLGLSVTALIGRALYKRGGGTGEMEGEVADFSNNNPSEKPADALSLRPRVTSQLADFSASPDQTNAPQASAQTALPPQQAATAELMHPEADHESAPNDPPAETFYGYKAAANESPWKISSKVFGDGKYTQKIVEANGGMEALKLKLKSGGTIKIPQLADRKLLLTLPAYAESKSARHSEHVAAAINVPAHDHAAAVHAKGSYKIEKGDTLTAIARKNYGNTNQKTIAMIVAANHGLDANSLKAGQEITLPAAK